MIDLQAYETHTVLSVFDELDFSIERDVKSAWQEALAGRPPALLVDLTAVPLLDSTGVRLLLTGCLHCRERGVPVAVLVSTEGHVGRVLELIGLARVLPLYQDREAALLSLVHRSLNRGAGDLPESTGDRRATSSRMIEG